MRAALRGHEAVVQLLLDHKADPNAKDKVSTIDSTRIIMGTFRPSLATLT